MSGASYEVRVGGAVGPAARCAFAELGIEIEPTTTVLYGSLDQRELHNVLERIGSLGLQLLDVRRTDEEASA